MANPSSVPDPTRSPSEENLLKRFSQHLYQQIRVNWLGLVVLILIGYGVYLLFNGPASQTAQSVPRAALEIELVNSNSNSVLFIQSNKSDLAEIMLYEEPTDTVIDVSQSKSLNLQPQVSPANESIAFISDRDQPGVFQVYIVEAAGKLARRLTSSYDLNGHTIPADTSLAWSPAGEYLAFLADKNNGRQVFAINLASGSVTQLTADPNARVSSLQWLNEQTVAFVSDRDNGVAKLWAIEYDGSRLTLLGG